MRGLELLDSEWGGLQGVFLEVVAAPEAGTGVWVHAYKMCQLIIQAEIISWASSIYFKFFC